MSRIIGISERSFELNEITATTTSAIDLNNATSVSIQCNVDVNTPAAKAFASTAVSVANDTATIAAHGFTTGLKGQLTTDGTLPTGLAETTDYFVIVVDANTIKFASSLSNALAGTAINITATGTAATDTFTPTALAGATVKFQKSNDGVNWVDDGSPTAITTDATVMFEKDSPTYRHCRLSYTLTAGRMSTTNHLLIKGFS